MTLTEQQITDDLRVRTIAEHWLEECRITGTTGLSCYINSGSPRTGSLPITTVSEHDPDILAQILVVALAEQLRQLKPYPRSRYLRALTELSRLKPKGKGRGWYTVEGAQHPMSRQQT